MSIKEEFLEALYEFQSKYKEQNDESPEDDETALWAAKWMAEKCAEEFDGRHGYPLSGEISIQIRQLANELNQ